VQGMLGLTDRTRVVDLFEHVMKGDAAAALAEIESQHQTGADPATVLTDLADFVHYVTRLKLAPNAAGHVAISETERVRGTAFAETLSLRELSRAWQMLTKGIQEVALVARPLTAAEMVLVRLCHAADLPTPDEAIRMATDGDGGAPRTPERARATAASPQPRATRGQAAPMVRTEPVEAAASEPTLRSFDDVIARARAERERLLVFALERHVRPVRFEPGRIEIALTPEAERDLPQRLMAALRKWTGERWMVSVTAAPEAGDTVHEARAKDRAALIEEVSADPLVKQVMEKFPGAEIVDVRERPTEEQTAAIESLEAPAEDEDL
jgi:DNA polymerase III subunit gamma/tau